MTGLAPHPWTWAGARYHRLFMHHLLEPADPPAYDIEGVVGWLCGIHAQVMPAAELSIGIRVAGSTRRDVRAALWEKRSLVKTYGIRGTIHLFPAIELPFWMAALRTRAEGEVKRLAKVGLDAGRLTLVTEAIGEALDGRRLTLKQLEGEVERRAGAWAVATTAPVFGGMWPRWRMALGWAAAEGVLCFGPNEGAEVTYVRPDQWLGSVWNANLWSQRGSDREALAQVYRSFVKVYGPATFRTFAQWFNIPNALAREIEASLGEEVVEVEVDGSRATMTANWAWDPPETMPPNVRLLPHFDCYLRGSFPREQLVGRWKARAAGGTGNVPVLLVDGVVGGIWQRRETRGRVVITVEPFVSLSGAHHEQLEREVVRIGAFLEAEPVLTIGPVEVRAHL